MYWETVQKKVSVGEGATHNAVSIQTIHKAKGLEYPVVIIPFANWEVAPRGELWLALKTLKADPLKHVLPSGETVRLHHAPAFISQKSRESLPIIIANQHREEETRTFLENMNLLYVAFTRPTDRLYIIAQRKDFSKGIARKGISFWLYEYLNSEYMRQCNCGWQEDQSEYIISACPQAFPKAKVTDQTDEIYIETITSGNRSQNLQLRRQAERVFDVQTFERTRDRDRKMVAALSLIKSPGAIDRTLRQLVSEGLIRMMEMNDLRRSLFTLINHPDLLPLFDPSLRIDTDRSILTRQQLQGAPHRVVHRTDGSVVLVQYQSVPSIEENDAKTLRYFTRLYREMGYPEVEGRLVYLTERPRVVKV